MRKVEPLGEFIPLYHCFLQYNSKYEMFIND